MDILLAVDAQKALSFSGSFAISESSDNSLYDWPLNSLAQRLLLVMVDPLKLMLMLSVLHYLPHVVCFLIETTFVDLSSTPFIANVVVKQLLCLSSSLSSASFAASVGWFGRFP